MANAHIHLIQKEACWFFAQKPAFFVANLQQTRQTAEFIRNTYNEDNITSA